jgi:hypothetical protein
MVRKRSVSLHHCPNHNPKASEAASHPANGHQLLSSSAMKIVMTKLIAMKT